MLDEKIGRYAVYKRTTVHSGAVHYYVDDTETVEHRIKESTLYTREILMTTDDINVAEKAHQLAEGK